MGQNRIKIAAVLAMTVMAWLGVNGQTQVEVPDSLLGDVRMLLSGKGKVVPSDVLDLNEKVLAKGDTVAMYMKERNLGRYDRGLFNHLFIPKGTWQFGLTASYASFNAGDFQILDLLSDFDFDGHMFSIRPSVSYFIRNNLSVGIRLGYSTSKGTLGSMAVDFDEDLNFNVTDAVYNNESYTAAATLRSYIGLSRRGRFGVFNDVELAFSSGHSDFIRNYDGKPKETNTTSMEAQINFSPGVCVFIQKNVCFNVSFGVVGFYLKNEKQRVDGMEAGNRFASGANFKFNVFNINFGLGVQI